MNPNDLRDSVIKAEGYAQGFKDGYASCAKFVALEEAKASQVKKNDSPEMEVK